MSKRKFALLALCAGLFVNLSFASTRKPGRNRNGLEGRSDLLLQGVLPLSTGGGASDGWNLLLSQGESSRGSLILGPGTPDNWNGGTGNWNSAGGWNNGVPGANSDVTIYSGGDDLVTLDTGASTINSLTLGGASNGSTSELTDVGITQTLKITQGLTIGQTGVLNLSGIGSAVTAGADSSNAGQIQLSNGSSLFINADLDNSGNIFTNGGASAVNVTGTLTNEAGGQFILNGPGDTAALGGLANSGLVDVENGSMLQINGDVTNSFALATDSMDLGGGNTLNITGTLTNTGTFEVLGPSDMATLRGLANSGLVDVENGSTLLINGDVNNSGTVATNSIGLGGNNTLTITGTLANTGIFELLGPTDVATIGNLANNAGGFIDVEGGSTLNITGDVNSSAGGSGFGIYTSFNGTGGNTLNIGGMLTNSGNFEILGPGDMATIGTPAMPTSMSNSGFVDLENGSSLTVNGTADNFGTLGASLNGGGAGGNTITVTGLLTNEATGTITLNGPGDVLRALGGLSNSGVININNGSTIDPPFVTNGGTINIGSMSKLVVGMGGYTQLANGTLGEMIGATGYGVINVNGSALLDGTLAILLQGGFNPAVGSSYKFLNFTSGELSGMFANVENDIFNNGTEKWFVDYENGGGYVELIAEQNGAPVSEPATLLVLIPGLLGMGYGLRRNLGG